MALCKLEFGAWGGSDTGEERTEDANEDVSLQGPCRGALTVGQMQERQTRHTLEHCCCWWYAPRLRHSVPGQPHRSYAMATDSSNHLRRAPTSPPTSTLSRREYRRAQPTETIYRLCLVGSLETSPGQRLTTLDSRQTCASNRP